MNLHAFQPRSLKTRVTLFTLTIFVISIWSLALYASRMLREDMQKVLGEQQVSTVSILAADVDSELADRLRTLEIVARGISPDLLRRPKDLQALLEDRPAFQHLFNAGAFVTGLDGTAIASVPLSAGRVGVNYLFSDYVAAALKEGRAGIGRPVMGKRLRAPIFAMVVPVRDAQQKVTGALVGVTDLSTPNFLSKFTGNSYGKTGGYVLLIPKDRLIVTATDKSRIMQPLPAVGVNPMLDRFLEGYEDAAVYTNPLGVEVLGSARLIPASNWLLGVTLPTEEAFAPIRAIQQRMLIAVAFLTLLAGGLTWWMLRRQLSPMVEAAEALSALSGKNQIMQPLPVARNDEVGKLIGGVNLLLETARQREEALKESEYRWQFAIEGAGDGVWDWNLETGKMLYSHRWKEMLGYSDEEIGDSVDDWKRFVRPEDMKKAMIALESYMDGIEPPPYHTEYQMQCKDGSWKWVLSRGMVVSRADDGRPLRMIGTHTDVTERTAVQDRLLTLSRAVENSPSSVMITDVQGNIEYVNPRFVAVTGYSAAEVFGRNPRILNAGRQPPEIYRQLWEAILAGKEWQGELLNRKKSGEIYLEQVSISAILDEAGAIVRFVAVKQDITLQRQAEKDLLNAKEAAESANRAKDEFLANITHELRTPLSAVIGFSSLARPLSTDPRQRDYLDKVNSAGKTLSVIIDDLLDLSKIAAGRLEFESAPFSLRQLVERSRSVIGFRAKEKGLQLVARTDDEVPDVLVGDPLRLEQILLNLLSNAVKFTAAGRVELRVGLIEREAQRVCVKLEVEDTGIGLSEEGIALLFKPFTQTDASMTRKFGGTGLGLAICKRLAEMMDGEISVTSREGSGTTFCVRLWLGLGEAKDLPAVEEIGPEAMRVRYQDVRVLVVDDQPFNRDIVEGLLAVVGITPQLAEDGRQAFDILAGGEDRFDLVLMDIQMPVMDGLTATRAIRSLDALADLPIIAMTAHTMAHEKDLSSAAGMNDHIGKPFDEAAFYSVLAKWIPRSKQHLLSLAATRPVSSNGLPLLNGVDTAAGLALLLGDEVRYCHWLHDFVAEAPVSMKQIRVALAVGQAAPASMAAHTLKGRMGLLGMKELHALAADLEAAIDGGAPASELLLDLERGVAVMCAEIRSGLGEEAHAASVTGAVTDASFTGAPHGPPPATVLRLIERLNAGDSDCDRFIDDSLAELKHTPWAPKLRQALIHVQNFDYAAASSALGNGGEQ